MADEIEGQEPENEEQEAESEVNLAEEQSLGRLFTQASSGHTPLEDEAETTDEESDEDSKGEETETPTAEDPRISEHSSQLQNLQDKLTELTTRNHILEHRLQNPQTPTQAQTSKEPEELNIDSFREMLKTDPSNAIFKLFQQAQKGKPSVDPEEIYNRARNEAVSVMERQKAYESDQASVVAQFGQLFKENKEFGALAENIFTKMTNVPYAIDVKPGVKWVPGAMMAAASMAYAQMHMAGRIQPTQNKVVQLRERKPAPGKQLIGDTQADKPRTIASDIPAHELSIMKRTAKSMGISIDEYLKIYSDMRKKDASFGR